ncbi:MAG: energy-coupling factor transporter ATPase [Clostridia bacterium]|nr:energy-coupling factor transporter ATPase [Clostridia bacterium]
MSDIYIHTEKLCFSYTDADGKAEHPALNGISVDIHEGEYVAVLGHNGSGKSTFAKLLNLILEPTSGKLVIGDVELTGRELSDEEVLQLRRNVGMVFQNPDNQLVATIVEEDVAFGPENLGVPHPELRERVDGALAAVDMSDYAHHEPHRLSGGQKQRVAIAGIIAMMPKCIIFDESTAMLDPSGRREVLNTIQMLNCEHGITVLNITHYMNEAAMADRILVINDGELLMDGTPDEIFAQREILRRVGLEVPQCAALIHELRKSGIDIDGTKISTVEDCAELIASYYAKTSLKQEEQDV